MPYVEDRRRRARERRLERLEEFRAYGRARHRIRMETDPAYRERLNARSAAWKRRLTEILSEIKLERGCADCGYRDDAVALDFDHVHGEKSFAIGDTHRSLPAVLTEIEKCEVVCANCHRIRTRDRIRGDRV